MNSYWRRSEDGSGRKRLTRDEGGATAYTDQEHVEEDKERGRGERGRAMGSGEGEGRRGGEARTGEGRGERIGRGGGRMGRGSGASRKRRERRRSTLKKNWRRNGAQIHAATFSSIAAR